MTEHPFPPASVPEPTVAGPTGSVTTAPASPSAERLAYFDNLKYVLIVLVVVGHFLDPFSKVFAGYSQAFVFIYLFHMPLFVFATGLFAGRLLQADGSFRIARVPQFLVLYLGLYTGLFVLERLAGKAVTYTPWTTSNASWYLLAAAAWYLLIPLFGRLRPVVLLPGLVAAAIGIGFFPAFGDTLVVSRVVCFAPFFFAGLAVGPARTAAWVARSRRWWWAAVLALVGAAVLVAVFPALLQVRGILSARNSYGVLGKHASWGPGVRAIWYVAATVLGASVLLLVPTGRRWFSLVGERSLQVYLWHLLALRGLALVKIVPAIAGAAKAVPGLIVAPIALALVVAHAAALRPPFGLISDWILRQGRSWRLGRSATWASAGLVVALIGASVVPWALRPVKSVQPKPAPTSVAPTPSGGTASAAAPGQPASFEQPLVGAIGFTTAAVDLQPDGTRPGGHLDAGAWFTILEDRGERWLVQHGDAAGLLVAAEQLVNLPDLLPSIVYRPTNATASDYRVAGVPLPGVTGTRLLDVVGPQQRAGRPAAYLPVTPGTAGKLARAQAAARAAGETLVLYDAYRPLAAQQKVATAALALTDAKARDALAGGGWDPADFTPLHVTAAQLGASVDLSLASSAASDRDEAMPTAMHDLGRAAATTVRPVRVGAGEDWRGVPLTPLTDAALRLRGYCTDAGLTPSPGAWWQFTDAAGAAAQPAANRGGFTLQLP